ncbi:conserved protein of unknown function [Rhodovastum atsumiense]|nr:conserved protein of unknown function [Rhodovastum atsumiense]
MHVAGMAPPGPDQPQPGPVAGHLAAELQLDGGIDQDAIDPRQAGGQPQQRHMPGPPARRIDRAPVRTHQAGRVDRLALGHQAQRMRRIDIEPDIGVDAHLMADMAAAQRAAPGAGDVTHVDVRQPRGLGQPAQAQQGRDHVRMPPERTAGRPDRLHSGGGIGQRHGAGDAARPLTTDHPHRTGRGSDPSGGTCLRMSGHGQGKQHQGDQGEHKAAHARMWRRRGGAVNRQEINPAETE